MSNERLFSRAVVRIAPTDPADGDGAADFLHGLVTNDVKGTLPVYAALLTAQGKHMFDFLVWPAGHGALLLDVAADAADELVKRLSMYRLRRQLTIERDDSLGVYWQAEQGDGGAPDPRLPALGQRWIAKVTPQDHAVDADWTAHRLKLGVAEGPAEMRDLLWLETNAVELNGVSFTKGCYVGQENTARMNWRQKVNRRLIVLPLAQSDESRRRAAHAELGLAVDHLRVDSIPADLVPAWMDLTAS